MPPLKCLAGYPETIVIRFAVEVVTQYFKRDHVLTPILNLITLAEQSSGNDIGPRKETKRFETD
jgi:hypothetical protein